MNEELPLMLILLILLLFAKVFGELCERIGIPSMTGEILAGLFLGPTLLGLVKDTHEIRAIADLGVLMLIVMAGFEIRSSDIRKALTGRSIWTPVLAFILPFAGGFLTGYLFHFGLVFNIFLGLSLSISALPVSIRILMDLGKLQTNIGQLIISTAIINDILALLFLGVMLDVGKYTDLTSVFTLTMLKNLVKIVIFVAVLLLIYRIIRIARNKVGVFSPKLNNFLNLLKGKESLFALCMIFILAFSGLAELMGLHFVIGAFFGAILIPKEIIPEEDFEKVKHTTHGMTMGFLAPIFFAYLGLLIEIRSLNNFWLFLVVLGMLYFTKTLSGYLGGRILSMNRIRSLTLGFGLNTTGIMALVIASIAFEKGFIDIGMFTILVLIAMITSISTPLLLKRSFRLVDKNGTP